MVIVSSFLEVSVTRQDVMNNPDLIGVWIRQNLKKQNKLKFEGCAMAVEEFGNDNPWSDAKVRGLASLQGFKDIRRQESGRKGAEKRWSKEESKESLIKKLSKIPKSKLKELINESESSSQVLSETFGSLLKEF